MNDQSSIITRLDAIVEDIIKVQEICKAPSISFGVLHHGEIIYRKSIGKRDVEGNLDADSDTSYFIGSCSKLFTSTALGMLLGDQVALTDKVNKHIPTFDPVEDPTIAKEATLMDLCRHSTGLANPNAVLMGPEGTISIQGKDHIAMVNALPTFNQEGQRFQKWWFYSNAGFGLLSHVIESVSEIPFHTFMEERLASPLGLRQTLFSEQQVESNSNVAYPYVQMSNGQWSKISACLTTEHHSAILASAGIRTSVNDFLTFLAAVLNAYDSEEKKDDPCQLPVEGVENPLKNISQLWNWWWTRTNDFGFADNTAYTMGWIRTTIPSPSIGIVSYNSEKERKDIIGQESKPLTLYGHTGTMQGSVASAFVIPETGSAIVAMSNTAYAGDAAETAVEMILQAVFDLKPRIDLIPYIERSRDKRLQAHEDIVKAWKQHRDTSKYTAKADDFVGSYLGLNVSVINIVKSDSSSSGLAILFNSNEASRCELEPYNHDALSFLPLKRDEILARSMLDWDYWTVGVLFFVREREQEHRGPVVGFRWQWEEFDYPGLWAKTNSQEEANAICAKYGKFAEKF